MPGKPCRHCLADSGKPRTPAYTLLPTGSDHRYLNLRVYGQQANQLDTGIPGPTDNADLERIIHSIINSQSLKWTRIIQHNFANFIEKPASLESFKNTRNMQWIKAFHIIFMVAWFAGLFYLPRLFVNHAMAEEEAVKERLAGMEHRLYRFIFPWMILTLGFGFWLLYDYAWQAYSSMLVATHQAAAGWRAGDLSFLLRQAGERFQGGQEQPLARLVSLV